MKKILGIFGLLVCVMAIAIAIDPSFANALSLQNLVQRSSLYAIMSIGAALVIVTGGIDLSIGSVVGLTGVLLPMLVRRTDLDVLPGYGWPVPLAVAFVLALSLVIGLLHGLLITKLRLQPFIVTLCGLMIYRGIARLIAADTQQGFGLEFVALRKLAAKAFAVPGLGGFAIPAPALILLVIAIAAA